MRTGEIKALTGLRIIAAVWVVLFHFRPLLWDAAPELSSALAPMLDCGAQGVDLFFILSGFVLTWNYLDRMGPAWSARATVHFLWLRLARVWPVYLVTLHLAVALVIFTLNIGHAPPDPPIPFTAVSYVRQLLLMQLWFEPFFDGSSWNGPAWSISAEWLAYLLFGVMVLVIFRMARVTRARGLLALAFVFTLPPVMLLLATGWFYTPWSWLPRIVTQFAAGALASAAVRKLRPSDRARRGAGYVSLVLAVAIVGAVYWLDAHPLTTVSDSSGLVDILFMPLVVTLTIGTGSLPMVLSTRPMVYGGEISFGLYMVHEIVHNAWNWAAKQFELTLQDPAGQWMMLGVLATAVAGAMALYHGVEEPARRWMRKMIDVKHSRPVTRVDPPAEPAEHDRQPDDDASATGTTGHAGPRETAETPAGESTSVTDLVGYVVR